MEVILKEDINNLGHRGDVVKVADGYGRNYLLPQKLALQATAANKAVIEQMKASAVRTLREGEVGSRSSRRATQQRRAGIPAQGGRKRSPLRFGHLV